MITFKSVSKSYGAVRALRDLSLELERGEVFGYIGPNGAGKTTTIKILTGLIRDYHGDVEIDGADIRASGGRLHARVGYLPQDVGFQEWRTVEHALQTFGLLSGLNRTVLPGAIDRVLGRAGITEHRKRRIVHLSGGTVQRLRLAQAILHDPDILVLDEPLSGLDPASRFQVKEIVRELAGQDRLVLVSSHILSEIEGLATRIGILHEGRIREIGTPAELRNRYQVGTVVEVTVRPGTETDWDLLAGPPVTRVDAQEGSTMSDGTTARLHIDPSIDLDDAISRIMKRLLGNSVPVRSIRHVQPSLEEVYLRLTGAPT
ncbi:MAG: ABC transporter ATP-binding protein [Spirochaetia bacterium]